jgi:hypothetical protein
MKEHRGHILDDKVYAANKQNTNFEQKIVMIDQYKNYYECYHCHKTILLTSKNKN